MVPISNTQASAKTDLKFKDVKANTETGQAIYSMVDRGIISGYSDNTFKPNASITYGQVAKILAGALNFSYDELINPNYQDITPTHANYKYIAALHNTGIFKGATATQFKPNTVLTRAKMADVLWRAYDLKGEGTTPFTDLKTKEQQRLAMLLYVNGITQGVTATQYGPDKPVTRAQLCTFIYRIEQKIAQGKIELDGPVGNLIVPSDEQLIRYVDGDGKAVSEEQYSFLPYIPGQNILIHETKDIGRFVATTKNASGIEKEYGIVTDYRNNQYRSYSGLLLNSNTYTLSPFQLAQELQENESITVVSIDTTNTVKGYTKRVQTFEAAEIGSKITLPIIQEGHTVLQVKYKVTGVTKVKNVHMAVYKIGKRYLVTDPLHVENVN